MIENNYLIRVTITGRIEHATKPKEGKSPGQYFQFLRLRREEIRNENNWLLQQYEEYLIYITGKDPDQMIKFPQQRSRRITCHAVCISKPYLPSGAKFQEYRVTFRCREFELR